MKHFLEKVYAASPKWSQTLALSAYGWKIRRERFTEGYDRWQRVFAENERRSGEELAALQDELVRDLIAYAFEKVPYYRDVARARRLTAADIRGVADLPKLPILTKSILRTSFKELVSVDHSSRSLKPGNSSGTTGSPVAVLWDKRVDVISNAAHWRLRHWAGFEFGDHYASLLGRTIVPLTEQRPPFWRWNAPWKQLLFSSFHLKEENLPSYLTAMADYGIRFLEAYPSTAYVLARFLVEAGKTLPLEAVVTSSETLLDVQRSVIEEAFACKVFDVFGQAERVVFAGECRQHEGLHVRPEYGVFEVLDEGDEPVQTGGLGRMIATGLQNYGMPLIRYETGDVSGHLTEPCPCGTGLSRMARVATKAEDIVITPEGRFVSSSTLTHPFKPLVNIEKSQIIQESPSLVRVKIVRRPNYSDRDTQQLLQALGERLGTSVSIEVEFVEDIPRGPGGKFRWVVSKVPLQFGASSQRNLYEVE